MSNFAVEQTRGVATGMLVLGLGLALRTINAGLGLRTYGLGLGLAERLDKN